MAFSPSFVVLILVSAYVLRAVGTVIYNIFFHPLRKYPGPLLRRASPIPKQLSLWKGNIALDGDRLHAQYGEIVRVAPNELSYIKTQGWKDILGRPGRSEMEKDRRYVGGDKTGDAWDLNVAPHDEHVRQRRNFAHAFSTTALRAQEPLLIRYADQMVVKMWETAQKAADGKINIVDLINFCTFDIMAELSFGTSMHMLERMEYVPWVQLILRGLKFVVVRGLLPEIPIVGPTLHALLMRASKKRSSDHARFAADHIDRRLASESTKPDIWTFVLKEQKRQQSNPEEDRRKGHLTREEMCVNAAVFMFAGTETVGTNLSGVFYYLCRNPTAYKKLTEEIRATFERSEDITLGPLSEMQYLNAVVNEGLRIYQPAGSGLGRVVPPGGANVCGDFIPGGTVVVMNHWVAYRHPLHFRDPLDFVPERWIREGEEDSKYEDDNREIFEPWGYGARNCIGKNLAVLELRLLLAKTLWHYDVEMHDDGDDWRDQKSWIAWQKKPLPVKVTPVVR